MSGVCCKLFLINLNEEEYHSRRFKTVFDDFDHINDFEEAELTGANILRQKEDGSCIYLKDNLCSIHKDRPEVCTKFFCNTTKPQFKDMVEKVNKFKKENDIPVND